jgi:GNAT superfamily N-acetyltransferase
MHNTDVVTDTALYSLFLQFKGLCTRNISRFLLDLVSERVSVYELYDVEEYMSAMGLCVDPAFRGQGLGLELLKARFDLGKAVGLKATMTVFTAEASQRLAYKLGMEVLTEILYEDCKIDGKQAFPNIKGKSMKVMGKRIE